MDYFNGLLSEPEDRKKRGTASTDTTASLFGGEILPDSYYAPTAPAPRARTNAPGLMSDVRRASGQFVSGVGSTLRDLGAEDVGGAVEQYGAGVVQRNPSEIQSFDDVLSRPFTTAREAVGEVAPQVGLALGGRALGAIGGGLIAGPIGAAVGGFIGGLLPTAAQTYGGIRTEQRAEGIDERGRALAVTIPAALLERFGGAERVALRVAGEGTEFLQRAAGTGFAKNASKQFVRGGLEEAITEIPQTGLERYGVTGETADLTDAEALDQYGVAGAKAFLGGGSVRAGLSSLAGTRKEPTVTVQPDGTIVSDEPLTGDQGETDLTGGGNVLMTPEQAAQRLQEIQGRRPAPLADTAFEPLPAQRGLFDTRGGEAPPAPVAGEQLDLFGGGGQMAVPVDDERQGDLFAPAEPTFQTRITAGLLDSLGLPRQSSMYRQLLGKDMGDATQQPQIAELFDRVRADDRISERTKAGIEGLAMQAFGGLAQQQAMFGPRGGAYPQGIPSTAQAAPGPIENILPTAPLGVTQPAAPELAPVEAPTAEAPVAPAPVAAPVVPDGVELTAAEKRAVKQAKAVFDIAETDADRRNVSAIMQRIIDRAAQRSAPAAQPVTPVGAPTAVAAALPAAPVAAGVSSTPVTTGAPSGTQASQAVETEAQRAKAPAAPTAAVVEAEDDDADAQKTIDELGIRPLLGGAAENLNASVQGGRINVGGRPTFAAKVLTAARDAFLSGKKSRDEQGGKLAQAARAFGEAYAKYLNAAGNMVPSESRTTLKSTKEFPQKGEQAQAEARAGKNVANVEKLWRDVQTALTALGQAAGNSAKNVEALIRLNKDKIAARKAELDRELGALGEMQDDTERESNVTIDEEMGARAAEIAAEIKALEKLDLGLSQGWAAAKRGTFRTGKDVLDVRGGEVRTSKEEQQQGFEQPLVRAAKYGYAVNKFTKAETGFQGVMNYIRSSGTPFERMIAKAVSEVFKNTKNPPKVVFAEGKSQFDPKNNTVTMSPTASPEVALHEALHAALQWFVHSNPKDPIVRQLVKSVNQVVKYDTAKLSEKAAEVQKVLADLVAGKRELDAVLELISYGNTLVEFRKALEAMPSKGTPQSFVQAAKDVWNMMLATVRRMLGVNNTAASDVLMGSFRLLQQAAETPQVGKATGRILKAEVTSLDAAAKEAGWADATAFAKGPGAFKTPTQVAFELIGLGRVNGRDLPITTIIKESGAKVAEYIRQNVPTLERMILNFNSKFSNGSLVNDLIERFKFMQNTGYLQMERISQHLMSHPETAKPFLDFMDGNSKALDGVQNGAAFKAIAENLQTLMKQYIDSLPANSPERRAFQNVKFSQYLLHPDNIGQVAGTTFGVKKLASMLGVDRRDEISLDAFRPYLKEDADGRVDIDDPLYQLFEDKGQTIPVGFISIEKFNAGLVPAAYGVDASRVWKISQYKEGAYKFTTPRIKVKEAKDKLDTEELSAALLNTTAALAHTFASRNFLNGIANIGRADGKATSGTVAFNDVEELNAAFPDARITEEKLLEVSDESSKSPQIRWRAQRTGVWVKLPPTETYGPLAGKIIPGPVWNSMLDMHDRSPLVNIQAFNDVMAFFKKSKTVYNPGTHVTNILSNVTLSILHGITPSTMGRAAKLFLDFERNPDGMRKEDLALMKAFYASGAVLGQFSSTEVKKTVYDKLNQAITPDSDSSYITKLKSFTAYERAKAQLTKYDNMASELYAAEDNVFRLAAFLNTAGNIQVRDGSKTLSDAQLEEAGLAGRKLFLDYDIDARAIRAMRQSFMPFISWSYAIMPVLGRIAIERPWAMANVMMTYALMQAALGGDDDEEKRKQAPEYLRDRAWGGLGPYMHMRLPFLGDDENPVYFNLGKYIPMFTLFQPPPGESKLAGQEWVPGFATPSGPLATLLSAMNGYDPFTGKPMHDPTDTQWDKLVNTGKAVYNTMAPAAVNTNFWKNVGDLTAGVTGPTGVEKSALFLARNLGGLGLYQFNVDESAFYQRNEVKKIKREFNTAIAKAKRLEYSKGYPDYEALDAELDDLRTRLQEEIAKARGEE